MKITTWLHYSTKTDIMSRKQKPKIEDFKLFKAIIFYFLENNKYFAQFCPYHNNLPA